MPAGPSSSSRSSSGRGGRDGGGRSGGGKGRSQSGRGGSKSQSKRTGSNRGPGGSSSSGSSSSKGSGKGRRGPKGSGSGSRSRFDSKGGKSRGSSDGRGRNDRGRDGRGRNDRDRNDRNRRDDRGTSTKTAHSARRGEPDAKNARAERSGWGSVAKHGAVGATIGQRRDEQETDERFSPDERRRFEQRQEKRAKIAERNEELRSEAREAIDRGGLPTEKPRGEKPTVERRLLAARTPKQIDVPKEMRKVVGADGADRPWKLFKRAAKEFEQERFDDALRTIKPLAKTFPNIPDIQELHGLCLYRLGKWDEAIEVLEGFRVMASTVEQHPVLMDSHRAIGNWADVDELWNELAEFSPSPELMAEGRIVMAGAFADRGRVDTGIRLLEKGWKPPREPQPHHLRRAYVLADLLEQDGKLPQSRKLFGWVASKAPEFGDAAERSNS